jgi:hypothetical protein
VHAEAAAQNLKKQKVACVFATARSLVVPGGSEKCVNVAFLTMYFENYNLKHERAQN